MRLVKKVRGYVLFFYILFVSRRVSLRMLMLHVCSGSCRYGFRTDTFLHFMHIFRLAIWWQVL